MKVGRLLVVFLSLLVLSICQAPDDADEFEREFEEAEAEEIDLPLGSLKYHDEADTEEDWLDEEEESDNNNNHGNVLHSHHPSSSSSDSSDSSDFYLNDDEEFEGFDPQDPPLVHGFNSDQEHPGDKKENEVKDKEVKKPTKKRPPLDFRLEMGYGVILLVFVINFFAGKSRNEAIAAKWVEEITPSLNENFAYVTTMDKQSQTEFCVAASGRRNCVGVLASLELKPRHDLFTLLSGAIWPQSDKMTIEVGMLPSMEPSVFALSPKKTYKQLHKSLGDLTELGTPVPCPQANGFVAITENEDLVASFIQKDIAAILQEPACSKLVNFIHVTDLSTTSPHSKMVRFCFQLPTKEEDLVHLKPLLGLAFSFVDIVAQHKLSARGKAQAERERKKLEAKRKAAQENEEPKKEDTLSEEEKQKKRQKEEKKQRKKMQGRFKVMRG